MRRSLDPPLFFAIDGIQSAYLRHQSAQDGEWFGPTSEDEPAKLNDIDPALPNLHLGYPAMWHLEARRQVSLGQPGAGAHRSQFGTERGVGFCMHRFFHCSHYRDGVECSQNRYTTMLTLPADWLRPVAGKLAVLLIRQALAPARQARIAGHLIGACLDLLVRPRLRSNWQPLRVRTLPRRTWRVRGLTYVYAPGLSGGVVRRCARLARSSEVIVIAGPGLGPLLRSRLEFICPVGTPIVTELDVFISWELLGTSIDLGWPRRRVRLELFEAYNRRVVNAHDDPSILIEIPTNNTDA